MTRTRLIRLILEELENVMAREHAREVAHAHLGSFGGADDLLEHVDGPFRAALQDQLGRAAGDAVADRIVVITLDLSVADGRDLAWIVANREHPAPVIVWPVTSLTPGWGKAAPRVVQLEDASFALLQKTPADATRSPAFRRGTLGVR